VALGGEKERAELAAFEALLAKWIADAKNRVPYSAGSRSPALAPERSNEWAN